MAAYLIGLLAGIASVALVLSVQFDGLLAFIALIFAPLPIAIAALGWGTVAAISSAVAAVLGLTFLVDFEAVAVYTVLATGPVALAGYQLGLARPSAELSGDEGDQGLVWYPIGRVLTHIALFIAGGLIILGILSGQTIESATLILGEIINERFVDTELELTPDEALELAGFYVQIMPFFTSAVWTALVVFNIWLGGRIVRASGKLARPWPDLAGADIDIVHGVMFAAAAALAFAGGALGMFARPIAGGLFTAFFFVGLGVVHTLVRGHPARSFILVLTYAGALFMSIPALVLAAMGALEPIVQLRRRRRGRTPPTGS